MIQKNEKMRDQPRTVISANKITLILDIPHRQEYVRIARKK